MTEEVRVTDPNTGGQKGQKPERFDLIPPGPLRQLARVYGMGSAKYSPRNWEKGCVVPLLRCPPAPSLGLADNPANQSVIIRADKRVQLDHAVFVMNACNQAGIFDYTLTTAGENN